MLVEITETYPVPFDQEKLFQRSYAKFQGKEELPEVKRPFWRRTAFRTLTAAACMILTVGLVVGVWSKQQRIETIPPQETSTTIVTENRAEETTRTTFTDTQARETTRKQAIEKPTETSRTAPETTAYCTEATESTAAAAQIPAVTAASISPERTAPASTAQTTTAAVTAAPLPETAPAYQTAFMKGSLIVTETAGTAAKTQDTTVLNGSGTTAAPETTVQPKTTAQPKTTSLPQSTAEMTELPVSSTTVSWSTFPDNSQKEELLMNTKALKKLQAMINAAVSAAALVTSPAMTTAAADSVDTMPAATTTVDLTEPPTDVATQYGDVNLDREVSMTDLIQLQRYLLGTNDGLGNWLNADLYEDGMIDVYDLALLKRQLISHMGDLGGSLRVDVVDMMSEEPLDHAIVTLVGMKDEYAYMLAEWEYTPEKAETFTLQGLPTDPDYTYLLELRNLPAGYGTPIGNWDQQYFYSYKEGETEKDVKLRVLANDTERNVRIRSRDWSMEMVEQVQFERHYGLMCITDREGTPYYPSQYFEEMALPDGDYIAFMSPFESYPVQLLTPDSEYVKYIHELYPDVVITDQSKGLEFTVKDGKPDRELAFDFGPLDGTENHLTITCVDGVTGEPLPGVELELTVNQKEDPKVLESWTTDETGSKRIDALHYTGSQAYHLHIVNVPEGYLGAEDQDIVFGYVSNYDQEIVLRCIKMPEEKNFSADILKWEDKSVINDAATYEIWHITGKERGYLDSQNLPEFTKVYDAVKPGEMVALTDGDYMAVLNSKEFKEKGYSSISATNDEGRKIFVEYNLSYDEFIGDTTMINFTIKDGQPTKKAIFYLKDKDSEEEDAS